jgi:hypothetical protein
MYGKNTGKTIVLPDDELLKTEVAFELPQSNTSELLRVIESLITLAGYSMEQSDDEITIQRILTPQQVTALRHSLGLSKTHVRQFRPARIRRPGQQLETDKIIVIRPVKQAPKN